MQPITRIVPLITLVLLSSGGTAALALQASAFTAQATPAPTPTPIPLDKVPLEAQSALAALQEIDASVSADQSGAESIARTVWSLTSEIDARFYDDTKLLTMGPSLDAYSRLHELNRLKLTWQNFGYALVASQLELTRQASNLEEQLARLNQLSATWQATLQSAQQPNTPRPFLQSVQSVVSSIARTRQAAESGQARVLTLQAKIASEQARVRTALSFIEQAQKLALKNVFVRDSPPIWSLETNPRTEWEKHGGESISSQLKASATFAERLPFTFLIHALFIALIATALRWMRRKIQKLAEENPDLQRALPILALPVSTGFALSILIIPTIYAQAPRLIFAIVGAVTLIPAIVILRRLLERNSYPLFDAIVAMYFADQIRELAGSLPVLARFIFLGQMLGASVFLFWLLKSSHLPTDAAQTHRRFWWAVREIARIGLIALPAAFFANIFGYVNLGNLLGIVFLRAVYVGALLYTGVQIVEGLMIIALEVWPLASLRVITLHRSMIEARTCGVLEFATFLFWLNLLLDFFGLRGPLFAATEAALNAHLTIGSLSVSLGRILAFLLTVWASFLVSRFLRFLLEEDVYHRFHLAPGIPYAISTTLHYGILLLGFFIALGALGIDLTKITILVGAFSVGIGFGLQNVINNFVSGLILLFERPIKIGDVIEVSGDTGEVRRIGIRASVIRTEEGSEVIVPNGSLISSQVTNWTFSDFQRALEVAVNVVGGSDLRRVMELLKSTAAAQPGVAQEPAPQVYVTNLSAAAVTLQLRAWTDRYRDWPQLRSDLSVAVNEALAREKIAIA